MCEFNEVRSFGEVIRLYEMFVLLFHGAWIDCDCFPLPLGFV